MGNSLDEKQVSRVPWKQEQRIGGLGFGDVEGRGGTRGDDGDLTSTVVRVAHVRHELRPVQVWSADPLAPLPIVAATITHRTLGSPLHVRPLGGYDLDLFGSDGARLSWIQYETLAIALDQAHAVLGIGQDEWEICEVNSGDPERLPPSLDHILGD